MLTVMISGKEEIEVRFSLQFFFGRGNDTG